MSKKAKGISIQIPDGFRRPPKPTRRQQERKDKINGFLKEYQELCEKHNLKLDAYFNYTPRGQVAILDVLFLRVPAEYEGKPEKIQADKEKIGELVKPFLAEYDELKKKHMIEFEAIIDVNDKGIYPKVNLRDIKPQAFQTKDWDEAKKENEAQKKDE
ncbi:MAG: hypothetical protein UR99_C0017G0035 [Candidatus Moranbacteria bacterium GW2011_GWD2_36_12]|nr:MAG: hypothetical protein UR99_C0017G0035 [Candidatus Moranbacteria bacterium GW2011_GWD2_36_12]